MKKIVIILVLLIVVVGGYLAYDSVFGTPEASHFTMPVASASPAPTAAGATGTATPVTVASAATPLPAASAPVPPVAAAPKTFVIDPAGTTAQFTIFEELRKVPTNVVGKTNQVSGDLLVDLNNLATAQVHEIKVDARGLMTDNQMRNNAMHNKILDSNQFEYIAFLPKQLSGLTGSAVPGTSYPFQISGDLTIHGVTKPAVFAGSLTVGSPTTLTGTATTTVKKADYGLIVPNLNFLANVGEDVKVQIDFKANAKS